PDARIPFARRSEQLNDLWRQDWRIKQRPALIEYGDARLSGPARGTLRHRIRNQHAHRGFEMCIRAEPLHIEKQPAILALIALTHQVPQPMDCLVLRKSLTVGVLTLFWLGVYNALDPNTGLEQPLVQKRQRQHRSDS